MKLFLNKYKQTVFPICALFFFSFVGCKSGNKLETNNAAGNNALVAVKKGAITERVTAAGKLTPKARAMVSSAYDGYVDKVFVKVGDKVDYMQALVSVAPTLGKADAEIFPLRSPIKGTVAILFKQVGERVERGGDSGRLLLVDDTSDFFVQANVPEAQIYDMNKGMPASIKFQALLEKEFKGEVIEVSQAETQMQSWGESGSQYSIKIKLLEKNVKLKSGMSCLVDIILKSKDNVLLIPHEYLVREEKGFSATLANGTKVAVQVGMTDASSFEVLSGLNEGDQVQMVDFLALDKNSSP